ncbi:hypothetical protein JT359_20415 [Candidatus Poribacteria bacterium]|nr:hypothetical protein [Candidatus Poribacteria bacterium]
MNSLRQKSNLQGREKVLCSFQRHGSEIESLPEDAIDTSEICELGDNFWENVNRIVPEITSKLNLGY